MVRVIKKVKVRGEVFSHEICFSDNEWALLQKEYPKDGNVTFHLKEEEEQKPLEDKPGREPDDDKPLLKDYQTLKDRGMEFFKEENWDKALYYFELAAQIKNYGWLNGKINVCKRNAEADKYSKRTM